MTERLNEARYVCFARLEDDTVTGSNGNASAHLIKTIVPIHEGHSSKVKWEGERDTIRSVGGDRGPASGHVVHALRDPIQHLIRGDGAVCHGDVVREPQALREALDSVFERTERGWKDLHK